MRAICIHVNARKVSVGELLPILRILEPKIEVLPDVCQHPHKHTEPCYCAELVAYTEKTLDFETLKKILAIYYDIGKPDLPFDQRTVVKLNKYIHIYECHINEP